MENQIKANQRVPSDVLDDLASRFIINIPQNERTDPIRLCFQIEQAYWFYIDFICKNQSGGLISCGNKLFALQLFKHIPFLQEHVSNIDAIYTNWRQYKSSVPTYGAILISEDLKHVLLVQSFWAKSSWGFPKGKINENEPPVACAIREVLEETGFNISHLIDANDFLESVVCDQFTRLYIVPNVPKTTVFQPQTRNEIKSCEWFPIEFLPMTRHDTVSKTNLGLNSNSFFMILQFVKRLKKWVNDRQRPVQHQQLQQQSQRPRHHSTSDLDNLKRSATKSGGPNGKGGVANGSKSGTKNKAANGSQNNPRNAIQAVVGAGTEVPIKILSHRKTSDPEKPTAAALKPNRNTESKRKLFADLEKENKKLEPERLAQVTTGIKKISGGATPKKRAPFPIDNMLDSWKDFKFDVDKLMPDFKM